MMFAMVSTDIRAKLLGSPLLASSIAFAKSISTADTHLLVVPIILISGKITAINPTKSFYNPITTVSISFLERFATIFTNLFVIFKVFLIGWLSPLKKYLLSLKNIHITSVPMLAFTGKQLKVLNSVVRRVSVYMMNNLFGIKVSTYKLFHNNPMFPNSIMTVSERMRLIIYKNITGFIYNLFIKIFTFGTVHKYIFDKAFFAVLLGLRRKAINNFRTNKTVNFHKLIITKGGALCQVA